MQAGVKLPSASEERLEKLKPASFNEKSVPMGTTEGVPVLLPRDRISKEFVRFK